MRGSYRKEIAMYSGCSFDVVAQDDSQQTCSLPLVFSQQRSITESQVIMFAIARETAEKS